jgi:hypothetical protein
MTMAQRMKEQWPSSFPKSSTLTLGIQRVFNSSMSGCKQTFILLMLTLFLFGMINATNIKNLLVVNHGGKL